MLGILVISFAGSLLAAIVTQGRWSQTGGTGFWELLAQPVPAIVLVPYSVTLLTVFVGFLYWQTRRHSVELEGARRESDLELARLRQESESTKSILVALRSQLNPRHNLVLRIALILADPPPYSSLTTEDVEKRLIVQQGNSASQVEIAETLGWMLDAGLICGGPGGVGLQNAWRERLSELGLDTMAKVG